MQLINRIHLQLVRRGNLVEDRTHRRHIRACNGRGIADELQRPLKILPRLDARGDSRRGNRCGGLQPKAGALHAGEGIVHDRPDGLRRMPQPGELRLGLLDAVESTQALRQARTHRGTSGNTDTDGGLLQHTAHASGDAGAHRLAGLLRALLRPRQRLTNTRGDLAGLWDDTDVRDGKLNGH